MPMSHMPSQGSSRSDAEWRSRSRGSHVHIHGNHKCPCGGDLGSVYASGDERRPSPSDGDRLPISRNPPKRRNRMLVCKECGKEKRRKCSPFLVIFSILNAILIILGAGLAVAAIYTSTLGNPDVLEDLRTFEYQYHLKHLMWCIGAGGILAAITGIIGLVAINPKVGNAPFRVAYELLLLLSAALLLILGALALSAILIRKNVVDSHFRPIMAFYQHEENPNPFSTLHRFQSEFRCCGLSKPPDPYKHLHGTAKGPLPWSCCANFTSQVLGDPLKVQKMVEKARNMKCTRDVAGTHSIYCDEINPELADWAFGSGIEALGVSLYCILLLTVSCIARRIDRSRFKEHEYGR